ncbi:hypothetical protein AUC71_02750 [Methyloceanibacter marginalis]|uniref:Uncharacterized protein n=1 Tax=Methyloceanibacter marginalis TaxID=1774971 RepID=A0A1E3W947_9HYPH|nr:hypothetical protein AUC71_02750 [Methyloceanibacter marginalis]
MRPARRRDDLPCAQADDAVDEHLGQQDVMQADDRWKRALAGDLADEPHDLPRRLRVERGGGLVDQQKFGVLLERPGDAHALPLAAGERAGPFVGLLGQPDPVEQHEGLVHIGLGKAPEIRTPERHVA